MGVIIGIDFGKKRIGLAHTDPNQMIASGLCTLPTPNVIEYLGDYMNHTPIDKFVVGQPKQMDGKYSAVENDILKFITELQNNFESIPVFRQDERFTSKIAIKSLIESGANKKTLKDKALVDQISATLILQSFLESISKTVI